MDTKIGLSLWARNEAELRTSWWYWYWNTYYVWMNFMYLCEFSMYSAIAYFRYCFCSLRISVYCMKIPKLFTLKVCPRKQVFCILYFLKKCQTSFSKSTVIFGNEQQLKNRCITHISSLVNSCDSFVVWIVLQGEKGRHFTQTNLLFLNSAFAHLIRYITYV